MTDDPTVVGGRYELGEVLGRGGMAEVRRAVDRRLGRPVAVKQLRTDLASDPTFQARFRREAQSAAGLNHPTIVAVYDTGEEPDPRTGVSVPYIVMELVEGTTLRDILREGRKILPERALELTSGVLDALSYSHQAGIIHRDIKPANVMLTPSGGVKVMDFGIARAVADTSATMTQTAAVIGTAQYLSPEQARGETVDARSDIYSAGCLIYELLVGRPPFVGESPVSVAYQHVREAPVPPSELDPEITPDVDAITLKALAKDAGDRYQSAREMKADITRVLAGQQATAVVPVAAGATAPTRALDPDPTRVVAAPPVVPPNPYEDEAQPDEEPKRRAGMVVLVGALILAVLAAGGFGLWRLLAPGDAVAQVAVANVVGYEEDQARQRLEEQRLTVDVQRENGSAETQGEVVRQDPIPATQVPEGSEVTVVVNDGPETEVIPSGLEGSDVDDAEQKLEDAGFEVEREPAGSEDTDADQNEVLKVSPAEGTRQSVGSTVTLTYATGKSEVPNFDGQTREAATRAARDAGFRAPTFSERESDEVAGTVISQNPRAGSSADRDTRIRLVLARARTVTPPTSNPPTTEPPESDPPTRTPRASTPPPRTPSGSASSTPG